MRDEMDYAGRRCLFSKLINNFLAPYDADTGVLAYGRIAQRHKSKKISLEPEMRADDPRDERTGSTIASRAVNADRASIDVDCVLLDVTCIVSREAPPRNPHGEEARQRHLEP